METKTEQPKWKPEPARLNDAKIACAFFGFKWVSYQDGRNLAFCAPPQATADWFVNVDPERQANVVNPDAPGMTYALDAVSYVPNYSTDLNACYEAENAMQRANQIFYGDALIDLINPDQNADVSMFDICHASAAMKVEAMLIAIGDKKSNVKHEPESKS